MFNCIDNNNHIIDIEEFCTNSKLFDTYSSAFCPFCGKTLIVKAKNSIERTHFSHKPKQSCCYKSYADFFHSKGIPKTSQDILKLKKDIIKHSYSIFHKIQSNYIDSLSIDIYLKVLKKVSNPKILKLRNLYCEHIPYIWLNELGKYNNKIYLYTTSDKINWKNPIFNKPLLWNTSSKKDIIITAEEMPNKQISRTITPINLTLANYPIVIQLNFLNKIINNLFNIFNLSTEEREITLKELLNNH